MKFAYADPPYIGMAGFYKDHPDYAGEVDHVALIQRLHDEFPDGWVLSLSSTTLEEVIACATAAGLSQKRNDYRVGAWVKPFCSFKPGVNPAYAWEPVLFAGGRKRARTEPTVRDWCSSGITLQKDLVGAKPREFCFWVFDLLGARRGDDFSDLFPGSGAVGEAWQFYQSLCGRQGDLFSPAAGFAP